MARVVLEHQPSVVPLLRVQIRLDRTFSGTEERERVIAHLIETVHTVDEVVYHPPLPDWDGAIIAATIVAFLNTANEAKGGIGGLLHRLHKLDETFVPRGTIKVEVSSRSAQVPSTIKNWEWKIPVLP